MSNDIFFSDVFYASPCCCVFARTDLTYSYIVANMEHSRESENNDSNHWSPAVVLILDNIRQNSILLAEYHRKRFFYNKGYSKYFDLPVLVLSIFGSSFAVGAQGYMPQQHISAVSCMVGVIVSIITSINLYLSIETTMQNELKMAKHFYILSIDIYRICMLDAHERGENGLSYLQKIFATYSKLVEESNLMERSFQRHDRLTQYIKASNQAIEEQSRQLNRAFTSKLLPPIQPMSPVPSSNGSSDIDD
jgi:hypothetical protein